MKDWTRQRIRQELKLRGVTMREVGRRAGYGNIDSSRSVFHQSSPPAERVIAEILNLRPQDIWPSRYDADGTPKGARRMLRIYGFDSPAGNVSSPKGT